MALRRTPMSRRTPLRARNARPERTTPEPTPINLDAAAVALARQAESIARGPRPFAGPVPDVSQRAPKPSNTGFPPVVRQTILDRDNAECYRCGCPIESLPVGGSLQHRDNRGMGGTLDPAINWPSNGIVLCGDGSRGCHAWVEEHEDEAARNGWAVKSWADPETVPVRHERRGWFRLTRTGTRHRTPAPANGDAHAAALRKEVRR